MPNNSIPVFGRFGQLVNMNLENALANKVNIYHYFSLIDAIIMFFNISEFQLRVKYL